MSDEKSETLTCGMLTLAAVNALRDRVEASLREIGEARVRELVAEGWVLRQWTERRGDTITLCAQLVLPKENSHAGMNVHRRPAECKCDPPIALVRTPIGDDGVRVLETCPGCGAGWWDFASASAAMEWLACGIRERALAGEKK